MQLIPDATKTVILQPYIGVGKGLISSMPIPTLIWLEVEEEDPHVSEWKENK
jgi:hypothetical protein